MDKKSPELALAIDTAKKASEIALKYYKSELQVNYKDDNSVVTKADIATENFIKKYLASNLPSSTFIAEESVNDLKLSNDVWIIDPIDGTRDFSNGLPFWSILIGYAKAGKMMAGVCYFPVVDLLIYGERGGGAYCNDEKISVSKVDRVKSALIGMSPLRSFKDKELKSLMSLVDNAGSLRGHNCSYSSYLVATGKHDGYIASSKNNIWDIAPFLVIIKEAGGRITDWEGNEINPLNLKARVIASNALLHKEILDIIN